MWQARKAKNTRELVLIIIAITFDSLFGPQRYREKGFPLSA